MIADMVTSLSVVILATVAGILLLRRLNDYLLDEDERIQNGVDCPKCGERTYAFERQCIHCGYNRWEGGGK